MESLKDVYRGGDPKKPVPKMVVGAFGALAGISNLMPNSCINQLFEIETSFYIFAFKGLRLYLEILP